MPNSGLGFRGLGWILVLLNVVQVWGRYMIIGYLDP